VTFVVVILPAASENLHSEAYRHNRQTAQRMLGSNQLDSVKFIRICILTSVLNWLELHVEKFKLAIFIVKDFFVSLDTVSV